MESQVETKLADKSHEESQVETKVAQEAIPSSLNTNAPGPMVSKEETSLLEDDSLQKTLEPIIDFFQKFPEQAIKILQVYKKTTGLSRANFVFYHCGISDFDSSSGHRSHSSICAVF